MSRIAASYEVDPALRDDLLQEIALALWRALPGWREEASMRTFVARIAHNRGASHVLGERRRPRPGTLPEDLPDPGIAPDHHTHMTQQSARLQAAVRDLPLALRQA